MSEIPLLYANDARNMTSRARLQKILQEDAAKSIYTRITTAIESATSVGADTAHMYFEKGQEWDTATSILFALNYKIERVGIFGFMDETLPPNRTAEHIGMSFSWGS